MRDRIKERNSSVIVRISRKARKNEAAITHRALSAFLRRPRAQVILHLSGWQDVAISELGFLETIRHEVEARGGSFRLFGFRDDLWARLDRDPRFSRLGLPEFPLKRSA